MEAGFIRVVEVGQYFSTKDTGDFVEGLYPTPHIHEQMTAQIMATSTTTLSTTR